MSDVRLPKVSIIVPCAAIGQYAIECVARCNELDYPDWELLLLPDDSANAEYVAGARIVVTGPVGPSQKRDIGAGLATGEVLAFLDDDAFPQPNWLRNAVPWFTDESVVGVGGPAVTPSSDALREQASGAIYESLLGGGPHVYRYSPRKPRVIDDYPTCNLLVRATSFAEVGGFGTEYWPGEDTKLCHALTRDLGKRMVYEPTAIVFHHRRKVFRGHLRQVAAYAMHRGHFVRKFPATSRRINYFLPSVLVLGLAFGVAGVFVSWWMWAYLAFVGMYLGSTLVSSIAVSRARPRLALLVFVGTILTHLTYGWWFLIGLSRRHLTQ